MKNYIIALFSLFCFATSSVAKTEQYDIVVIGAGGAGFSAAVQAKQSGAGSVVILEKQPIVGGHTAISGGSVNAVDPKRQEKFGIKDSPELMTEQVLKAGDYRANPALVKILAEQSESAIQWLEDMGLQWNDQIFEPYGGLFPRGHNSGDKNAGADYIRVLNSKAKELGIKVVTNMRAIELIRADDNSPVTGVIAENKKGEKVTYNARAVIIATGGFTANVPLRMKYDRRLDEKFFTSANPTGKGFDGSTGDGLLMAKAIGADDDGMNYIQLIPLSGGRVVDYVGADIYVNAEGKRFVSEGARRDQIADATLAQTGSFMWVITDSASRKGASYESRLKAGIVQTADTIEDLAKIMDVDPAVIKDTLDRYNQYAKDGKDPEFGKETIVQTIDHPPYVVGKEVQNVHFSCGGLRITPKTEVVDVDGNVIQGLYAAGEVTGGVHGTNRAGGNALTDNFVFGRIAGENAANFTK